MIPAAIAAPSSANRFAPSQALPIGRLVFRRAPTTPTPPTTPLLGRPERKAHPITVHCSSQQALGLVQHAPSTAQRSTSHLWHHRTQITFTHIHTLSCIHHSPAKKNRQPLRRRHNPPNLPAFFCPATSRFVPKGPFEKPNPPSGSHWQRQISLSKPAQPLLVCPVRPRLSGQSPSRCLLQHAQHALRQGTPHTTRARAANRVVACSRPSANPIPSVRRPLAAFTASRPPFLWTLLSTSRLPSTLDEHPHHHTFTSWPCLQTPTPIDAPAARHASTLVGPFVLLSPTHHDSSSPHSILHALRLLCSCTLSKRPPLLPRDPITTRPGAPLPPPLSSSCLPTKHDALPDCRLPAAAPAALPPVSRRLPGE